MKTINFKSKKFAVDKFVKCFRQYRCGSVTIKTMEVGKIIQEKICDYPDLGLFGIRIIDIKFGLYTISVGEKIAEMYFEELK